MKKKNSVPLRSDLEFKKFIEEIKFERYMTKKDKKPLSTSRLTLAITRVPNLKKILKESNIK